MLAWDDFANTATQLAVLVAATGLFYRIFRLFWPEIPEAVMQVVAAILSTALTLAVIYTPAVPRYQWIIIGVSSGLLTSMQVIKLLDWSAAAVTKTGAPDLGIAEKPPQWYIDLHPELFMKTTAKSVADAGTPTASVAETRAQILSDQRADAQAKFPQTPARTRIRTPAELEAQGKAAEAAGAVTPLRVPEPPPVVAAPPVVPDLPRVPRERDLT